MSWEVQQDRCPECGAGACPALVEGAGDGVSCSYRCTFCGCEWVTAWWGGLVEAPEMP